MEQAEKVRPDRCAMLSQRPWLHIIWVNYTVIGSLQSAAWWAARQSTCYFLWGTWVLQLLVSSSAVNHIAQLLCCPKPETLPGSLFISGRNDLHSSHTGHMYRGQLKGPNKGQKVLFHLPIRPQVDPLPPPASAWWWRRTQRPDSHELITLRHISQSQGRREWKEVQQTALYKDIPPCIGESPPAGGEGPFILKISV